MFKFLLAAYLSTVCLALVSGAGCAQRPAAAEAPAKVPSTESSKPAGAEAQAFVGHWTYERKETCASKYAATLNIYQADGQNVSGEWTSYNSENGLEGNVTGEFKCNPTRKSSAHGMTAISAEAAMVRWWVRFATANSICASATIA
jgi:hypothetical protein